MTIARSSTAATPLWPQSRCRSPQHGACLTPSCPQGNDATPASDRDTTSTWTKDSRLGYVPALDGLRGVAILLVVSVHLFGFPNGGVVGVDLFFVLSGFLITTLILDERAARGRVSLRGFYVRRARRLLPALAVLLAVYLVIGGHLRTVLEGGLYTGNLVAAYANPNPLLHTGIDHLWSLAEEEQFYLLWPCLLLAILRARHATMLVAAGLAGLVAYRTALLVAGARAPRVYYSPDTHACGILAGCLLALILARRTIRVPEPLVVAAIAFTFVGVLLGETLVPGSTQTGLELFELAFVILVAAAATDTPFAQAVAARPLVWLGKISYSLYLWHLVIFWRLGYHDPLLALALSLAAAVASYRFVEQPFRRRRGRPTLDVSTFSAVDG